VGQLDAPHFAARGEGAASVLEHWLSPLHLLDLANLVIFLVPLAALAFLPAPRGAPSTAEDRRAWIYLLLLAGPLWAISLVLRPAHGMARGFDVFVLAGLALALVIAMRMGRAWRVAPALSRWAGAVAMGSIVPVLSYLLLQADLDRSLVRVQALADGPPVREVNEQARLREYLGARLYRAARYPEATEQFARSAELIPTPNILALWTVAARRAGDLVAEEKALRLLLQRTPADRGPARSVALTQLARLALERGDRQGANELIDRALREDPSSVDARALHARIAGPGP
jgi:tetratricopeptide (TPR) repeat protein